MLTFLEKQYANVYFVIIVITFKYFPNMAGV